MGVPQSCDGRKIIEDGINDLVDYIYDKFIVNDLTTANAIYKKYGKDSTWAFKVTSHMEKMKKIKSGQCFIKQINQEQSETNQVV